MKIKNVKDLVNLPQDAKILTSHILNISGWHISKENLIESIGDIFSFILLDDSTILVNWIEDSDVSFSIYKIKEQNIFV